MKASVKTAEGRWVAIHSRCELGSTFERMTANGDSPPLVIVVGLGLGYLLDVLERQHSGTRVLAIEPIRSVTRAMLARRDWDTWLHSGRLTLLVGPDYPDTDYVPRLLARAQGTPPVILSPLLQREFADQSMGATLLLRKILCGLPSGRRQAADPSAVGRSGTSAQGAAEQREH